MATSTLATLLDRLSQRIGDYLEETVTTELTTSKVVICTDLADYVNRDDFFNRQWLYVTDNTNIGAYRKISDYDNSATQLTVLGANFAAETPVSTAKATFQIHKYDRKNKIRAINIAARQTHPNLFRNIQNTELITGNVCPPFRFPTTSTLDFYAATNTAIAQTTSGSGLRGYGASAKLTNSAANGALEIHSDNYPPLLDLQGKSVDVKMWVYPENDNDITISINTGQADGTAQNLISTTTCKASKWTLLELEDQALNDNLSSLYIKIVVATNGAYAYIMPPRVIGLNFYDYLLPNVFDNGEVSRVYVQSSGDSDDPCDDIRPQHWSPIFGYEIIDDGTYKYLRLPTLSNNRQIKLIGTAPLEDDLSAVTSTMTIEDPHIDLLIEYAAYALFDIEAGLPSSQDRDFLRGEAMKYRMNYEDMKGRLRMVQTQPLTRFDKRIV